VTTLEGIVTAVVVVLSFVGIAAGLVARSRDRRTPLEPDPRYDDLTGQ
jgi:hypothetical protein